MIQKSQVRLAALASLIALPALQGATDQALVDLLVANGVISADQAAHLDVSNSAGTDSALIALLVSNGALTQAQANSLTQAPAPAPTPAPAPSATPAYVVAPKGKKVQALTISGRLQAQMDYLSTDYDSAIDPDEEFNLFLRRLYLGASVKLNDGIKATLNTNFGNDAAGVGEIEKAIIAFGLTDSHTLTVGFQKTSFGYEETTSSSKIPAVERSLATRYFTEQLDYGARYAGLFLDGEYDSGLNFSLAVTNSARGAVSSSSSDDNLALWGRLGWEGEVSQGVEFDLGVSAGSIPDQRIEGATDMVLGFYANAELEALRLQFEYLTGSLEGAAGGADANPAAFHITGIWELNPEFELVGRVAFFDADGGVGADISDTMRRSPENGSARYDEAQSFYFGGNWFLNGNDVKLSAGYEWADYSENLTGSQGDATVNGVRTRLQLLF